MLLLSYFIMAEGGLLIPARHSVSRATVPLKVYTASGVGGISPGEETSVLNPFSQDFSNLAVRNIYC